MRDQLRSAIDEAGTLAAHVSIAIEVFEAVAYDSSRATRVDDRRVSIVLDLPMRPIFTTVLRDVQRRLQELEVDLERLVENLG